VSGIAGRAELGINGQQRCPCDIQAAPDGDFAIAVFSNDVGMDAAGVELQVLREEIAEARCIKSSSRADNGISGKARKLPGNIRHHIDGIAHDQVDRIRAVLHKF
jgi:hypothetical protein